MAGFGKLGNLGNFGKKNLNGLLCDRRCRLPMFLTWLPYVSFVSFVTINCINRNLNVYYFLCIPQMSILSIFFLLVRWQKIFQKPKEVNTFLPTTLQETTTTPTHVENTIFVSTTQRSDEISQFEEKQPWVWVAITGLVILSVVILVVIGSLVLRCYRKQLTDSCKRVFSKSKFLEYFSCWNFGKFSDFSELLLFFCVCVCVCVC